MNKHTLYLLFFFLFSMTSTFHLKAQEVTEVDSLLLVELYEGTNGENWTNNTGWLTEPVKKWYGVELTTTGKQLLKIDLANNNLTGEFPTFSTYILANSLEVMYLQDNNITGSVSDYSNRFPKLKELNLGNNQLGGLLLNYTYKQLEKLHLYGNSFIGKIPNFSNMPTLLVLELHDNLLNEELPNFSQLPALKILSLHHNRLTGAVINFDKLAKLEQLFLNNNLLSEKLPDFDNLLFLKELDISNNELTGKIPNYSKLPNLTILRLNNNFLTGNIPNFDQLENVVALQLNSNQLTGQIPSFEALPKLEKLWLSFNQLSEIIPDFSIFNQLELLHINNNKLTFEGLERNIDLSNLTEFYYAPQAEIPLFFNNDTLILYVSAGGDLNKNSYEWFENEERLATISADSTFLPKNNKTFYAKIENAKCTRNETGQNLVLATENFTMPDCFLNIKSVTASSCKNETNTYDLNIEVDWKFYWQNEITVDIFFQNDTLTKKFSLLDNNGLGEATLVWQDLESTGEEKIDVRTYFEGQEACQSFINNAYDAPVRCCLSGGCNIKVLSLTPADCNPIDNTYDLAVELSWSNAWTKKIQLEWQYDGEKRSFDFEVNEIDSEAKVLIIKDLETNSERGISVLASIEVAEENCEFQCRNAKNYDAPNICNATEVWPGDANNNGVTNIYDLLTIGLNYGSDGLLRPDASLDWVGQDCRDWEAKFEQGIYENLNHKYADCDGNDTINELDSQAVSLNYNLKHGIETGAEFISPETGEIPLFWSIPDTIAYRDFRRLGIHLGDANDVAQNIYGIAFKTEIKISDNLIGKIEIPFSNENITSSFIQSWLGTRNEDILIIDTLLLEDDESPKWELGLTHFKGLGNSGFGEIAALNKFNIFINNFVSVPVYIPIQLIFKEVQMLDKNGMLLPVRPINKTVYIKRATGGGGVCNFPVHIVPNPANDFMQFKCISLIDGQFNVTIFDVLGRIVYQGDPLAENNSLQFDTSQFAEGMYFIQLLDYQGETMIEKVLISH